MPPSYTQLINDFIVLLKPSARRCRNLLTRHDYVNDSIVLEEHHQNGPKRRFLEANDEISTSRKTCNLLKMTNSVTIALISDSPWFFLHSSSYLLDTIHRTESELAYSNRLDRPFCLPRHLASGKRAMETAQSHSIRLTHDHEQDLRLLRLVRGPSDSSRVER